MVEMILRKNIHFGYALISGQTKSNAYKTTIMNVTMLVEI